MGKVSDTVTLGASYTSKVTMDKFDKYKDLFAGQVISTCRRASAWVLRSRRTKMDDRRRLSADRLFGHQVGRQSEHEWRSDHRRNLGCDNLPRFRLEQRGCVQARRRISVQPELDLAPAINHTDNPIQSRDVTFNMIAPGWSRIMRPWASRINLSKESELTMATCMRSRTPFRGPAFSTTGSGQRDR